MSGSSSYSSDEESEYEVERILAQDSSDGKTVYLVKWKGYEDCDCTWEPAESFLNADTLTEWRQQLAVGDTLDDEQIAVVQERMDARARGQKEKGILPDHRVTHREDTKRRAPSPLSDKSASKRQKSHDVSKSTSPINRSNFSSTSTQTETGPALAKPTPPVTQAKSSPLTTQAKQGDIDVDSSSNPSRAESGQTLPTTKAKRSIGSHTSMLARDTQDKAGQRFKNLRHQNNFAKLSRREPTPDISKLCLRAPNEWPDLTHKTNAVAHPAPQAAPPRVNGRDSPLFIPDEREPPESPGNNSIKHRRPQPEGTLLCTSTISVAAKVDERMILQTSRETFNQPRVFRDPNPITMKARNGRVWNKGDVAINLRFGAHAVGDVKILHLPPWLRTKLLALKEASALTLSIHFKERNVMDVGRFSNFFLNLERGQPALGSIEAYSDTLQSTDSLADHLEVNNLGAVWEYPESGESLIMILYSCRAPGWHHLGQKEVTMFESRLHLAVYNTVPGFHLSQPMPESKTHPRTNINADTTRFGFEPKGPRPELDVYTTEHLGACAQRRFEASAFRPKNATDPIHNSDPETKRNSVSSNKTADPGRPIAHTHDKIRFSADWDYIIGPSEVVRRKPRVFISFAKSHPVEAEAVKEWLLQYLNPQHIFTDAEKNSDGWKDWMDDIGTKTGIVLFYEDSPAYGDLEFFSRLIQSSNILCYSLSFHEFECDDPSRNLVTRLFPRGTGLFITEDTMTNKPTEALWAMQWFEQQSTNKVRSWKLGLMPNAVEWVSRQAAKAGGETQKTYAHMLEIIHRLRTQTMEALWKTMDTDTCRYVSELPLDEDEDFLVSSSSLPGYDAPEMTQTSSQDALAARDKILLDYFCGWGALNATKYRKYFVLDSNHTNKSQRHAWHMLIREPTKWVEDQIKLDKNISVKA